MTTPDDVAPASSTRPPFWVVQLLIFLAGGGGGLLAGEGLRNDEQPAVLRAQIETLQHAQRETQRTVETIRDRLELAGADRFTGTEHARWLQEVYRPGQLAIAAELAKLREDVGAIRLEVREALR